MISIDISIHALLAESDLWVLMGGSNYEYFYPRSPCGERLHGLHLNWPECLFLSTLSLRRATLRVLDGSKSSIISIHALLAESDSIQTLILAMGRLFLSTLSLRRATTDMAKRRIELRFLSTLSLRRATSQQPDETTKTTYFYPRSPCGERHSMGRHEKSFRSYFYPRSPCGERQRFHAADISTRRISIHALLAESDGHDPGRGRISQGFLSTLSLRRATFLHCTTYLNCSHFYPRSPCGERLFSCFWCILYLYISIHALLAESDTFHQRRCII